jgi:predicted HTH transcriptional regulator
MNAYIHRCWRTAAPVLVSIDPGFLEFQNPGELLPGLHVANLLHCVPSYRNLLLAEAAPEPWV